jgi:peptide deformylase
MAALLMALAPSMPPAAVLAAAAALLRPGRVGLVRALSIAAAQSGPAVAAAAAATSLAQRLPPGAVRDVVCYPHPALAARCPPVADPAAPDVLQAAADLLATVTTQQAMGLAAPQLALPVRVFVVRRPLYRNDAEARAGIRGRVTRRLPPRAAMVGARGADEPPPPPPQFVACIDPRIVSHKPGVEVGVEACLSFPDSATLVRRYADITVAYVDASTGAAVQERLTGLPAVVFQHELDHLDGVTLPDREVRTFLRQSAEQAWDAAQERFMLGLQRYYGIEQADRARPELT